MKTIQNLSVVKVSAISLVLMFHANTFAANKSWNGDFSTCVNRIDPWRLAQGIAEQKGIPFFIPQPTFGNHMNTSNGDCWTGFVVPDSTDNMLLDSYTGLSNRLLFLDRSMHVDGIQVTAAGYDLQGEGQTLLVDEIIAISNASSLNVGNVRIVSSQNTISNNSLLTLNAGTQLQNFNTFVGFNGNGTLQHQAGSHNVDNQLVLGFRSGQTGTYNLEDGSLSVLETNVGWDGIGDFNQTGGTHTVSALRLGRNAGSFGTYNLQGGTLNANQVFVGDGIGRLNVDGGTLNLTGSSLGVDVFSVGNLANGSFTQQSGKNVTTSALLVGETKNGTYNQTGGVNTVSGSLILGRDRGSNGIYNLSGGSLSHDRLVIGSNGNGTFNQTGGIHNATSGQFYLGQYAGSAGTYNLSGGTLNVNQFLNGSGHSTLNMSGGTLNHAGSTINVDTFRVSSTNYSLPAGKNLNTTNQFVNNGTFTQSSGSNKSTNFYLADDILNGIATYNLNGGRFETTNFFIGGNSLLGVFNLNGGTFLAKNLNIGATRFSSDIPVGIFNHNAGSYFADEFYLAKGSRFDEGTYNMNGGGLGSVAALSIGFDGKGVFNQNGGNVSATINGIVLGKSLNSKGIYNLNAGTLNTSSIKTGFGAGTLNIDGGSLSLTGSAKFIDVSEINIGYLSGKLGTHTVRSGEKLTSRDLAVGNAGTGGLTINSGGQVRTKETAYIGRETNSAGVVRVAGTWDVDENIYVGGDEGHSGGSGRLNVFSGGIVNADILAVINANSSISTGNLFSTVGGQINVDGFSLSNGGKATSFYGVVDHRATNFSNSIETESLFIDGAGSQWDTTVAFVGFDGTGSATVRNQGNFTANDLYVGTQTRGNGTLTVTTDGKVTTNATYLGNRGSGKININTGGELETNFLSIAEVNGSQGTLNVMTGGYVSSRTLLVGNRGEGLLNIGSGGIVDSLTALVGVDRLSSGEANVSGLWRNQNNLSVGSNIGAAGSVNVNAGGVVETGGLNITGNGEVNNTAGTISVAGALSNSGTLTNSGRIATNTLGNTGTINNARGGVIDISSSSTLAGAVTNNGIITISDDELLTMSGDIFGDGSFIGTTFLNGATVNPGNSPGAITFDDTIWSDVGLTFEIGQSLSGLEYDSINILGDLTLLNAFTINFEFLDGLGVSSLVGQTFSYLNISGNILDGNNCVAGICQQVTDFSSFVNVLVNGWSADWKDDGRGGYRLDLSFAHVSNSVPSPSTISLFILSILGLLYSRRRVYRISSHR